jgi:hypothetical protein
MYDPTIGRWISEDPIGFQAADPNLYRYAGNKPTDNTDPSGEIIPAIIGGAAVGGILAYRYFVGDGDGALNRGADMPRAPILDWGRARLVGPSNVNGHGDGQRFEIPLRGGGVAHAWRPGASVRGDARYWCHGLSFGGVNAPGGPFSIDNRDVDRVLRAGYNQFPIRSARAGDVVIWRRRNGDVAHSAILTEVQLNRDNFIADRTRFDSKDANNPLQRGITLALLNRDFQNTTLEVYRAGP